MRMRQWPTSLLLAGLLFGVWHASIAAEAAFAEAGEPIEAEAQQQSPSEPEKAPSVILAESSATLTEGTLKKHVKMLSSDLFMGRKSGTEGARRTHYYLKAEFQKYGLEKLTPDTYEQWISMLAIELKPGQSNIYIGGAESITQPKYGEEIIYWLSSGAEKIKIRPSEVVFVGYGINAPEYGWNDYADVKVKNKVVVMLFNDPGFATEDSALFRGRAMTYYGLWEYKFEEAARRGARAAILVHDFETAVGLPWTEVQKVWGGQQLWLSKRDMVTPRVPVEAWMTTDAAKRLFAEAGLDFTELSTRSAQRDFKAVRTRLRFSALLNAEVKAYQNPNILGVLRGSERPDEYVLYMANWDHLGTDRSIGGDNIYNGAVDNATGLAAMLAIAEAMSQAPERPRRSVIFLATLAENRVFLGARFFAGRPLVPLENIVGGYLLDTLLPLGKAWDVTVVGAGISELEDRLAPLARQMQMEPTLLDDSEYGDFYQSELMGLALTGVPMLYATPGLDLDQGGALAGFDAVREYQENRLNTPDDEFHFGWKMDGLEQFVKLMLAAGYDLANTDVRPNWYPNTEFRRRRDKQLTK